MKEKITPTIRMWRLIQLDKKEISSIYFYAILGGLVQLSVPVGVQAIIGFVLGASMVTSLYILIILVVLGVFLVGVFQMNQMKIIEKIQQRLFTRYAFEFAEKIPQFDLRQIDNAYLPEVINRFFDTINIQKGLSKLLLDIPTALIQILFGLVLLALYHPVFIVFGVLLVGILWTILRFTSENGLATSTKESSYKYAVVAWLQEMGRTIKSFKFSQGTHFNLQKTDKNVMGYLMARTAHFKVLLLQYRALVMFKVVITTAMLTIGTYLLLNQKLNIGEFIAAEIVILTVVAAVEKLISSLDSVYDVITGLEKLATVTEIPLENDGKLIFDSRNNGVAIELVDFNFDYPNDKKIFDNINLRIPANSITCISGKTGSGKTTFLKILSGSYSDFGGAILLNNIPIGNFLLESLRQKVGIYLNQQDIFVGTVWENISLGNPQITAEQVLVIAQKLGIEDFLREFPKGFETDINPMGKRLASTTIKKILLLRALVGEPSLLLLDEPWEGLSEDLRNNIVAYLLKKLRNTTVLVSSNDENFAKQCDYQIQISDDLVKIIKN